MSELAHRYGVALFQVTQDNQSSHRVYEELKNTLKGLNDPDIMSFFKARDIDRQEKIDVLNKSFDQDAHPEVLGLLKLLVKNHRVGLFPAVVGSYESIYYEHENIKIAQVISAIELSESQINDLRLALEKKYSSRIDLRLSVDSSLIQGMIIRIENDVIDNSLKSKFKQLQTSLRQGVKHHGY